MVPMKGSWCACWPYAAALEAHNPLCAVHLLLPIGGYTTKPPPDSVTAEWVQIWPPTRRPNKVRGKLCSS
jgi:hypothetical protein